MLTLAALVIVRRAGIAARLTIVLIGEASAIVASTIGVATETHLSGHDPVVLGWVSGPPQH